MKIGELVRCPRCNSENPTEYRFCGMCGTPLDKPAEPASVRSVEPVSDRAERLRRTDPVAPASSSVSGPSFLGLGAPSERSEDVTYLFEEEQPKRTYWRFTLLLIILGVVGALGWLQYSRSRRSWSAPWENQKPTTPVQASQQPAENPPSNPAPSASGGNASPGAQNANQNPTPNAAPKETDIAPGAVPPTGAPQNTTPNNPPAADSQSSPPQTTGKAEKSSPEAAPDSSKTAKNEPSADTPETASNTNTESAEDADTPEAPATKPKAVRKPKPSPVPATDPDQALVSNAEKYLYGQGVPQNCDRALVSLRAAADRQSARARSLLGTMYATGHCVPKDLPNAYRWFALASRQQTDNMWIQRNLEMIWREMTPQERQLAMQTNR